jgi:uncharacterized protein YccT (UPF0319 family)
MENFKMVKLTKAQIAEKEFQELKDSWSTLLVSLISKINSSKFIQHDTEIEYDTLVIVFTDTLDDTTYTLPVYAENLTKNYSYEYYQLLNDVDRHIQEIEEEKRKIAVRNDAMAKLRETLSEEEFNLIFQKH